MGKEIEISSLEDMCSLMCDNQIPEKSREYQYCLRCGRKLKNPEARAKGYGLVCERKLIKSSKMRLFKPRKNRLHSE